MGYFFDNSKIKVKHFIAMPEQETSIKELILTYNFFINRTPKISKHKFEKPY